MVSVSAVPGRCRAVSAAADKVGNIIRVETFIFLRASIQTGSGTTIQPATVINLDVYALCCRLSQRLDDTGKFSTEFFIDASHELALFVWDNGTGNKLTPTTYFCSSTVEASDKCAVYTRQYATCVSAALERFSLSMRL